MDSSSQQEEGSPPSNQTTYKGSWNEALSTGAIGGVVAGVFGFLGKGAIIFVMFILFILAFSDIHGGKKVIGLFVMVFIAALLGALWEWFL